MIDHNASERTGRTDSTPFRRRTVLSSLGAVVLGSVSGCTTPSTARIEVAETALRDEVTPVRLRGFPSDTQVTVTGSAMHRETTVASRTTLRTDSEGAAVVGSAESGPAAIMRWLWLMSPGTDPNEAVTDAAASDDRSAPSMSISIAAQTDGGPAATATQKRRQVDAGVERRPIRETDLVGELFVPAGSGPHPGVLVLHGSGGDPVISWGRLLASHGIAAFAVDYFGLEPGNERALARVPLSYFDRAARRLRTTDDVCQSSVGVVGTSRGSEAALLAGVHYDWVGAVVALAPSIYVWRGIAPDVPAWTRAGDPVPYLNFPEDDGDQGLTPEFRNAVGRAGTEAKRAATIPVERVDAPMLFVSGQEDRLWPAAQFADRAMDRLAAHDAPHEYEHLCYAEAGHAVSIPPFVPTWWTTETSRYVLGGTASGNARAAADAWPQTLSFLRSALDTCS